MEGAYYALIQIDCNFRQNFNECNVGLRRILLIKSKDFYVGGVARQFVCSVILDRFSRFNCRGELFQVLFCLIDLPILHFFPVTKSANQIDRYSSVYFPLILCFATCINSCADLRVPSPTSPSICESSSRRGSPSRRSTRVNVRLPWTSFCTW